MSNVLDIADIQTLLKCKACNWADLTQQDEEVLRRLWISECYGKLGFVVLVDGKGVAIEPTEQKAISKMKRLRRQYQTRSVCPVIPNTFLEMADDILAIDWIKKTIDSQWH